MFVIDEIKAAVHEAASENQKLAMFHYQVLKNARDLEGYDAVSFCRDISVPETYRTEFRKMISLARIMAENGAKVIY